MSSSDPFFIQKGGLFAIPVIHYNMETACQVKLAYETLQPDCVAVELPETMQLKFLEAAARLPDISVVISFNKDNHPIYFVSEPCEAMFEALRSAAESSIPAFCIDLDVDDYPDLRDVVPDPYAIQRLGLKCYFELFDQHRLKSHQTPLGVDLRREMHMARRLKELSLRYDKVLFISGMTHVTNVLRLIDQQKFPDVENAQREMVTLAALTEHSCRDVMAECGYITTQYEQHRENILANGPLDRQQLILKLYKDASKNYTEKSGNLFPGYHLRNIMKFVRNYALTTQRLMPDLFQILTAAKGCVDSSYAYEVWDLATSYEYRRNIDSINELDLSIEDVWKHSKLIRFYLKEKSKKSSPFSKVRKDRTKLRFQPPGPFSICSYPPEDVAIERFGDFLKKKGIQIATDEASKTIPFSTSLEEGIDMRETLRHWFNRKLYVKTTGKPPGGVGSICVIFDEDRPLEGKTYEEKYSWKTTWLGEHDQESDMSLYATQMRDNVVGPGISKCQYGGFMMSYPPRRMLNVWYDPDYDECISKSEVLLMAAIDYAVNPVIVYVAATPPRHILKNYAKRYGKKIVYLPLGQLSPIVVQRLRFFHVLDGHSRREIADEYID